MRKHSSETERQVTAGNVSAVSAIISSLLQDSAGLHQSNNLRDEENHSDSLTGAETVETPEDLFRKVIKLLPTVLCCLHAVANVSKPNTCGAFRCRWEIQSREQTLSEVNRSVSLFCCCFCLYLILLLSFAFYFTATLEFYIIVYMTVMKCLDLSSVHFTGSTKN